MFRGIELGSDHVLIQISSYRRRDDGKNVSSMVKFRMSVREAKSLDDLWKLDVGTIGSELNAVVLETDVLDLRGMCYIAIQSEMLNSRRYFSLRDGESPMDIVTTMDACDLILQGYDLPHIQETLSRPTLEQILSHDERVLRLTDSEWVRHPKFRELAQRDVSIPELRKALFGNFAEHAVNLFKLFSVVETRLNPYNPNNPIYDLNEELSRVVERLTFIHLYQNREHLFTPSDPWKQIPRIYDELMTAFSESTKTHSLTLYSFSPSEMLRKLLRINISVLPSIAQNLFMYSLWQMEQEHPMLREDVREELMVKTRELKCEYMIFPDIPPEATPLLHLHLFDIEGIARLILSYSSMILRPRDVIMNALLSFPEG